MAKKRRDKKRDPSTKERILKAGKAALAVGAGVAFFSRSGLRKTVMNEVAPAILDTTRGIRKDLFGKKKTASAIYDALDNRIGLKGQNFSKTLLEKRTQLAPVRTGTTRNLPGALKNIGQVAEGIPKALEDDFQRRVAETATKDLVKVFNGKYTTKEIDQIVKSAMSELDTNMVKDEFGTEFLKKTQEKMNMSDDDINTIFKRVVEAKSNITSNKNKVIQAKATKLTEDITTTLMDDLIQKRSRSNTLINRIGNKIGIKNLDDKLLKEHSLTLGEFLEHADETQYSSDMVEQLQALVNKNEAWKDVIFDKNIRVRNGEIYDTTEASEFLHTLKKRFDSTLPGRVFTKGIDRDEMANAPGAYIIKRGTKSAASAYNKSGAGDTVEDALLVLKDKVYRINEGKDGYYEKGEMILEAHSYSNKYGSVSGVMQRMLGSDRTEPYSSDNFWLKLLDINQDGRSNLLNEAASIFSKFKDPEWGRSRLNRVQARLNSGKTLDEQVEELAKSLGISKVDAKSMIHQDNQLVNSLFSNLSNDMVVSNDAIAKMINTIENYENQYGENLAFTKVKELLNLTLSATSPEETLTQLVQATRNGSLVVQTTGLEKLLRDYEFNSAETLRRLSIETKVTKKIPILDMENATTNVEDIQGIIRKNILKEVLEDDLLSKALLQDTNLTKQEFDAVNLLKQWTSFEHATYVSNDAGKNFTSLFNENGRLNTYQLNLANDQFSLGSMNQFINEMRTNFGLLSKGNLNNLNEHYYPEYNAWDIIPKSQMSLSKGIVENVNAFIKELNGGRDNLQNVSPVTIATQYMINRLSYGVEGAGLGLSYKSMSSPLSTFTNMMTKRVLPAMLAYTAFDYINDMSQDITGVGITGAMANTAANADLMGRRIAYGTGIGQALDWFKRTSVIAEYWTGSTEFQDVQERKDWYREGYSPVRKSRFWSFGSASEFRGGDISFFQPNYLRRIHSDYKDKVLYGSNKEKWAHSIVPTPTHPFSTVRYLMDPYWLEKKHMDDAPTPLTGKMFSEGTVWGAVLNPTIGAVIKPQRMLPETRKRMTGKGHDSKAIVRKINERIKRKRSEYDDMIIVSGTDIRNATYIPYGNATPGVLSVNQNGIIPGIDYMEGVNNFNDYRTPDGTTYTEFTGGGFGPPITRRVSDNQIITGIADEINRESGGLATAIVSNINNSIKRKGRQGGISYGSDLPNSKAEGTFIYNNLVNEYNNFVAQHYSDIYDPKMINNNRISDFLADAKHSTKNLLGIYGFAGESLLGENSYTIRYENAGSYSSFSRGFWDAGIGGLGGGVMEIARRFFPSQDRSRIDYNPLVNNMPEWLPEKFRTGVPWTKVTKGEMRLPGAGYESLNELHPDEFADENGYGSFDKFKILADVAPNSNEYKTWHNIVKHNITDPDLKRQIKEIEARTKRMSGNHEFFDYQYLHTNTKYEQGIVKEIQKDGTVLLANNQVLTLAGIEFNDNYNGELGNFIAPGQRITYRTTDDAINDLENGVIRNAAIYSGNENINKKLIDMGVADRDMSDTTSIGQLATVSSTQEVLGAIQELVAHARIPIVHNKLMHIETPLESFISEQVNGANFQTWDHPIEGFIKPMINETLSQSLMRRSAAHLYRQFHFNKVLPKGSIGLGNKTRNFASGFLLATLDPMAMLGGTANTVIRGLNFGRNGKGDQVLGAWSQGAKWGSLAGDVMWAYTNASNPVTGAITFGALGLEAFKKLDLAEFAERFGKKLDAKGAAAIGAGIGIGVSLIRNSDFDLQKTFGKWQPKKYKEITEMNEYFDRLEYIKYKGLYEVAARRAALLEGTNVKAVFKNLDKNKKKIAKLQRKAEKLLDKYDERDHEYINRINKINQEISSLREDEKIVFKGGKYTKSAIAYKKAMESTIYGLSEGATKDEILAAVPDQYKDYFQRFMNETDESERKKILKHLPDYLKRPLQAAWGHKMENVKGNNRYFQSHKLPGVTWRGWKPNINLRHVQMKTVQNEGMLLADFGFYESEKGKAAYEIAPDIENYDQQGFSMFQSIRLAAELKGFGLNLTDVNIDRTTTPGMWIGADIKQTLNERTELATNSVTNVMQGLVSNFI